MFRFTAKSVSCWVLCFADHYTFVHLFEHIVHVMQIGDIMLKCGWSVKRYEIFTFFIDQMYVVLKLRQKTF